MSAAEVLRIPHREQETAEPGQHPIPSPRFIDETWEPVSCGMSGKKERLCDVAQRQHFLTLPLRWRRPRRVVVGDDLFLKNVTDETRGSVFTVIRQSPQHRFELATCEAQRMCETLLRMDYLGENAIEFKRQATGKAPLRNVWLGIRVSSQEALDSALPWLLQAPAVRRFIA